VNWIGHKVANYLIMMIQEVQMCGKLVKFWIKKNHNKTWNCHTMYLWHFVSNLMYEAASDIWNSFRCVIYQYVENKHKCTLYLPFSCTPLCCLYWLKSENIMDFRSTIYKHESHVCYLNDVLLWLKIFNPITLLYIVELFRSMRVCKGYVKGSLLTS